MLGIERYPERDAPKQGAARMKAHMEAMKIPGRNPRRAILVATAVVLCTLLFVPAADAQYTAASKAGRGLAAMTCGFLEIPGNIVKVSEEQGQVYGFTLGFVEGLGRLVVRELVGVYEFVSSPFEVPEGYRPILEPEYPWDYYN
jgi:putative exosortase-associated protein (TIGR04073 family)